MRPLEFGWYLPTHGDTTAYGLMDAQIPGSPELCDRVVQAAEAAGFEYLLIPVGSTCWEAWISGAFMAARSSHIKPLIAARPGYIVPRLQALVMNEAARIEACATGGRILASKSLIERLKRADADALGIDTRHTTYTPLADLAFAWRAVRAVKAERFITIFEAPRR